MKANINFSLEVSPEEILTLAEGIQKLEDERMKRDAPPVPQPVASEESWTGKSVKIKQATPDSEIESWMRKLERSIVYGVSIDKGGMICIRESWYRKVWFELGQ